MRVCWHWHGGSGYGVPYPNDKPEQFASLKAAKTEFEGRLHDRRFPCLEHSTTDHGGPSAWVFVGTEAGDYPDFVMEFGPRGGVRVSRA